jgi:pyrroloquinoline quinone biosynthesis protein D
MSRPDPASRPKLASQIARQIDPVTGGTVLLYPEGIIELSETAAEIVSRCDGEATIAAIAAQLAEEFDVPEDELLADVCETLTELSRRQIVVFVP